MTREQVEKWLLKEYRVKYKDFVIEYRIKCARGRGEGKYVIYIDGELLNIYLATDDINYAINYFMWLIKRK